MPSSFAASATSSLAIEICPNKLPSTVYVVATGPLNSFTLPKSCKMMALYKRLLFNSGYISQIDLATFNIVKT